MFCHMSQWPKKRLYDFRSKNVKNQMAQIFVKVSETENPR